MLLCGTKHLFWSHPRDDDTRLQGDGHALCGCGDSQRVYDLEYKRLCLHEDTGVLQLLLDKVERERRPEGQKLANSTTRVTNMETSEQWSRGASHLRSAWSC